MNSLVTILSLLFLVQLLVSGSQSANITVSDTRTTWTKAKTRCNDEGGHLAIINSEEKLANVLSQVTNSNYGIHVGFYYSSQQWRSVVDASVASGIAWTSGQPQILFMQNCAAIIPSSNGVEPELCDKYAYYACEI